MEPADKRNNDVDEYHHPLRYSVSADPCKRLKKTNQQPERKKQNRDRETHNARTSHSTAILPKGTFTLQITVFFHKHSDTSAQKASLPEQQNTEAQLTTTLHQNNSPTKTNLAT